MLEIQMSTGRKSIAVADKTLLLLQARTGFVDVATGKKITNVGSPAVVSTQKVFSELGSFDFRAGRVDIGTVSDFNFGANDEFTIEFWAWCTSTAAGLWFISKGTGTTSCLKTYGDQLYLQNEGSSKNVTTGSVIGLNRWTHFAVVHKSGQYVLFIDGVNRLSFTAATQGFGNPAQLLRIGGYEGPSLAYMDQIRVSRVARYWGPGFPPSAVFTVD